MMLGRVRIFPALEPGVALGVADQVVEVAEGDSVVACEALRSLRNQHHVRTVFENGPRGPNGILHALECRGGAGAKRCAIHYDGVALHAAIQREMRAVARVEDGIIFQHHDRGLDGVQCRAAARKNAPTCGKRALAAGLAGRNCFVRNVPGAAVNDQGRFHRHENRKATSICPPRSSLSVLSADSVSSALNLRLFFWLLAVSCRLSTSSVLSVLSLCLSFDCRLSAVDCRLPSNIKIEQKKQQANQKKHATAVNTVTHKPQKRIQDIIRDGLDAGFRPWNVERAGRDEPRKAAVENGNLVLDPHREIV